MRYRRPSTSAPRSAPLTRLTQAERTRLAAKLMGDKAWLVIDRRLGKVMVSKAYLEPKIPKHEAPYMRAILLPPEDVKLPLEVLERLYHEHIKRHAETGT